MLKPHRRLDHLIYVLIAYSIVAGTILWWMLRQKPPD